MSTRKELIEALRKRYHEASKVDKARILDEFTSLTDYHRKHAIRVLSKISCHSEKKMKARPKQYDEVFRQSLIVLWEASDRICGKRLKAMIPLLLSAMERHGRLTIDPIVKDKLLSVSAATIDRVLSNTREYIDGQRKRRGHGSVIRRHVPVRTFSDWGDPVPGFFEVDMVEHCGGPKTDGNFVHTLVLTDIASGWTECIAMPLRNQSLIVEAFDKARTDLPFAMRGVDTDNDSAFMNQTIFDYCKEYNLVQTRSRAYKKNDQAWVEQKNGAIVRHLVGYGRLTGIKATEVLARLYTSSRLYINYFQPSFKLKSKIREGARVSKKYYPPKTPCERILALPNVDEAIKDLLRQQFAALDPVGLLQDIRFAQQQLADCTIQCKDEILLPEFKKDVGQFLNSLSHAWKEGEVRPTYRQQPSKPRTWRTRADPFEQVWPMIEQWLIKDPTVGAKELMIRLVITMPDVYTDTSALRTLQRRIKQWRTKKAKEFIYGSGHLMNSGEIKLT